MDAEAIASASLAGPPRVGRGARRRASRTATSRSRSRAARPIVLRIGGRDTDAARHRPAARARGIADRGRGRRRPGGRRASSTEGYLVTRFVDGRDRAGRADADARRAAAGRAALRRVHGGAADPRPASTRSGSSRPTARPPSRTACSVPPATSRRQQVADRIERARGQPRTALPQRPPERELHRRRRAGSGSSTGSTRAWATASSTSPTSPINHELDEDRADFLLESYFGEVRAEDEHALALMRFMSDFREAMWGVVQQGGLGARRRLRRLREPSTSSGSSARRRRRTIPGRSVAGERSARAVVIGGGVGGCVDPLLARAARLGRRPPRRAGRPDERLDLPLRRPRRPAPRLAQR